MTNLCYLSANDALSEFKSKRLSPVELMDAIISRAEGITATVNPFADTYFEKALAHARIAEKKYVRGSRTRSLEGIPLAVKDASFIKGTRTTFGSLTNSQKFDSTTDPTINRLINAGAIIFAKTTCPEFCWLFTCHSRMWGVTRNPWRLDITPGGSSGGSGAALAAGATTIATGTDSTGSIRQPAAQCGVVGYKAPYGRNPLGESSSFDPYVHVGPMTRTVSDAGLLQNVMSGPHPLDHNSLQNKVKIPIFDETNLEGCRIAFSMDLGHYEVVSDVARESRATLDVLEAAGAEVDIIDVDWASEAIHLAHASEEFFFAGHLNEISKTHGELLSDYVPELVDTANSVTVDEYRRCPEVAGHVWKNHLGPLFQRYDALLCPTVSCPEVPAECWQKTILKINGKLLTDTDTAMTAIFNMFNRCPALCIPSGITDAGLPTGIQIVTKPYHDRMAFRIATTIERLRPWLDCSEKRPDLGKIIEYTAPNSLVKSRLNHQTP